MWEYRAALIAVHDGDTCRLLVDTGFYGRHQVDIRLLDVYAPELGQVGGAEAKGELMRWFLDHYGAGLDWHVLVRTQITKTTEPTELRTFTRYVGDIYSMVDGSWANDHMRTYLGGDYGTGA